MIPLLRTLNAMVAAEPMIRCTFCGGSGESHSAERDLCCPACDGIGKRPALGHGPDDTDDEPSADEVERLRAIEREFMR
jgi:hypothetical protein